MVVLASRVLTFAVLLHNELNRPCLVSCNNYLVQVKCDEIELRHIGRYVRPLQDILQSIAAGFQGGDTDGFEHPASGHVAQQAIHQAKALATGKIRIMADAMEDFDRQRQKLGHRWYRLGI